MQSKKEYFCWVRAIEPATPPSPARLEDTSEPAEEKSEAPAPAATLEDLQDLLLKVRTTCPVVSWNEIPEKKWPPKAAPLKSSASPIVNTTRMVLGVQQMATVHLEHAAAGVFPLQMDMMPIFGTKNDAIQWIESPAGSAFCVDAQAVTLMCFTVVGES